MALDFPNTPQTGQTYTGGNGVTYVFDGTKWVSESALGYQFDFSRLTNGQYVVQLDATGNLVIPVNGDVIRGNTSAFEEAGAVATVSDTEPDTGDATFWFNTIDGRLYIKDNGVWVDSSPTLLPTPSYITSIMEDFEGNIVPAANVTYSLGTQQAQWKDLWVSNNTIYIGNTPITVSNGSLLVNGNVISGGGASTGNISFVDTTMTSTANLTVESGGNVFINPLDGDYSWQFGTDGTTTFPGGGHISATKGGTALDAGYGYNTSLTTFYANANYAACVTGDAQTGTLNITAYNDGGPNPSRVWSFDKTGNLTLPAGGDILDSTGSSVLGGGGAADTGNIVFSGTAIGLDEGTADAADIYINISPNAEGWAFLQLPNDTSANTANTRLWNAAGNVEIGTGDFSNLGASYTWNFNKDGSLTLPGKLWAKASDSGSIAFTNNGVDEHGYLKVDAGYNMIVNAESNFSVKRAGTDRLAITDTTSDFKAVTDVRFVSNLAGSNKTWTFAASGIATLPSNNYLETTDTNLKVGSQGTVTIRANAATVGGTQVWTFGTNGATTFPGNISVPGNLSNIAGFAFYNGDPISIVATEPINSIRFIQPYYIEIPKTGLPAGFNTLLGSGTWTVTANASTFTVVMVVPNGDFWNITVAENPNGTLTSIATFNRAASGANIVIPSTGSITFANGVNILSTVGTYSNANVASYLLQFDGDIEFTSSTAKIGNVDVVTVGDHIRSPAYQFSNGASILANVATKVTSSWTVATGTNTYSFTVPASGTYQLWVDCNIPNGILAWNATATVTNSNVPVVGAQYAWVYTGGGTPIDFTSIPNQFTGTANTIVRNSTAPSATTNRFDFGINNTSGGNVTVTYGYIKIS